MPGNMRHILQVLAPSIFFVSPQICVYIRFLRPHIFPTARFPFRLSAQAFLKPRVTEHPHYAELLVSCKAQQCMDSNRGKPLKIVDLGCCFGQDTRQLIIDGIPPSSVTAIDIHNGEGNWSVHHQNMSQCLQCLHSNPACL